MDLISHLKLAHNQKKLSLVRDDDLLPIWSHLETIASKYPDMNSIKKSPSNVPEDDLSPIVNNRRTSRRRTV